MLGQIKAKLSAILNSAPQQSTEAKPKNEEGRFHERFPFALAGVASIRTASGAILPVRNISYGGFATDVILSKEAAANEEPEAATLTILDQSVATTVKRLYQTGDFAGYCFVHNESKTLIFLREILECLRYGSSLSPIKKEFLKSSYQSKGWLCLRGEGPTDIIMHLADDGNSGSGGDSEDKMVDELMATTRMGESYFELRLANGVYSTGKALHQSGTSAPIQTGREIEPDIVRMFAEILLGINDPSLCKATETLASWCCNKLGRELR